MKEMVCTTAGVIGAVFAGVFGGWDSAMTTLLLFMAIDYVSGMTVAGVFHASEKTPNGALESRAGWKGLCRKGMSLLCVLIAGRLDILTGAAYFRDAVCIGFIVNELISITENAGLMGIPLPSAMRSAVDLLTGKGNQR